MTIRGQGGKPEKAGGTVGVVDAKNVKKTLRRLNIFLKVTLIGAMLRSVPNECLNEFKCEIEKRVSLGGNCGLSQRSDLETPAAQRRLGRALPYKPTNFHCLKDKHTP
jgi:hypothetical protein